MNNLLKTITLLLFGFIPLILFTTSNQNSEAMNEKSSVLIHLTQGPENPTVAALAFLVARTAVEEGHSVTLFLAGDAVQLMREGVMGHLNGLGTGSLKEHYEILANAGCEFYLSGMSSNSRELTDEQVKGKNVTFASPRVLVELAMEHEKMFVY